MSFDTTRAAWYATPAGGNGVQAVVLKNVLLFAGDQANGDGDAIRPGNAKWAMFCAVDVKTLKRAVAELCRQGWLVKVRDGDGGRKAEYRFGPWYVRAQWRSEGGAPRTPGGVRSAPKRGGVAPPRPRSTQIDPGGAVAQTAEPEPDADELARRREAGATRASALRRGLKGHPQQ